MPEGKRALVLGGSGLLGRYLRAALGPSRALVTFRSKPVEGGVHFDAASMRLRDSFLRGSHGITSAFILYGVTQLDACALDPHASAQINVASIHKVIDDLLDAGVKPVFTSSDAVFDGSRGLWSEEDVPNPILTYGRQKLEVERYLAGMKAPFLIARLSKVVSGFMEERNPLSEWIGQIERGEPIRCATDLIFSPMDVRDAADAMVRLADGAFSGLFHVCGPEAMSRMHLLRLLLDSVKDYGPFQANVLTCRMRDLPLVEPRPLDVSMSPAKLYAAVGNRFRNMASVCAELAERRFRQLNHRVA